MKNFGDTKMHGATIKINKFYFHFTSRDVKVILFTLKSPTVLGHVQYNDEL
jgi:hypothetical protein